MRVLFIVLFTVLSIKLNAQESQILYGPAPDWVLLESTDYTKANVDFESGGLEYLKIDIQDHIENQQEYVRFAYRITNSEGLRSSSDIQIEYDPSYQKLSWHSVRIIRDGVILDKFDANLVQVFRKENDIDRYIYDGSETAVLNLRDVRIGDVIEYSYSTEGFNPLHEDEYFANIILNYGYSFHELSYRVLSSANRKLNIKSENNAPTYDKRIYNGLTEYIWLSENTIGIIPEEGTPGWFNPYQTINISTFEQWSDIVEWALPHYTFSEEMEQEIINGIGFTDTDLTNEERILKAIKFVQDDVRYLGFESGMSVYKPNNPLEVFKRRFGDCKDKSVLLAEILQAMEIDASPMLVNTEKTIGLGNSLPSPSAFDHCVVVFNIDGLDYFIDPTISNQGGSLSSFYFPNYGKGLILKRGVKSLIDLPVSEPSRIASEEVLTIRELGKGALYSITTDYHGEQADFQRAMLQRGSINELSDSYLDFYSSIFPSIQPTTNVEVIDARGSENRVTIKESYVIEDLWEPINGDSVNIMAEYYPLVLSSYIGGSLNLDRRTPLYLGSPFEYSQETLIHLPEDWEISRNIVELGTSAFDYISSIERVGDRTAILKYNFVLRKEWISSEEVADFITEQAKIEDELTFVLTYNTAFNNSSLSWLSTVSFVLALLISGFIARSIHMSFDPEPQSDKNYYDKIGGWLLLFSIGIAISPIRILVDLLSQTEIFNSQMWSLLFKEASAQYNPELGYLILFELLFNAMMMVFAILIVNQIVKMRSSLPKLAMLYLGVNFVVQLIDGAMVNVLVPDLFSQEELTEYYGEIFRSFVACCIWIPYFNISKRVKQTFTNRLNIKPIDSVMVPKPIL